jgi:UDP-glucose 4-epimerase
VVLGRTFPDDAKQAGRVKFLQCDFSDVSSLYRHRDALASVDAVVHLGGSVPRSPRQDDPVTNITANPLATAAMVGLLARRLRCFCYASTIDVYGVAASGAFSEADLPAPASYYGVSKLATEQLIEVFARQTGVPATVLRLSHVYGPGDTSMKAIPTFIRAVLRGETPILRGDGSDSRDYIYVDDVVQAILLSLEKTTNGTFNIGSGESSSVLQVAMTVSRLLNSKSMPAKETHIGISPATYISLNIERARTVLGFRPEISLDHGLGITTDWFKKQGNG